jgi:hypothetical protein
MNGIEQYQNHLRQQSLATVASAEELAKHFQAIAAAHADNAKRSFKEGAAFLERLAGGQIARTSTGNPYRIYENGS